MGFLKGLFGGRSDRGGGEDSDHGATARNDPGIFAGLFVASPAAVDQWDFEGLTPREWPAMEFKHLQTVKLGTLEAILTGVTYDNIDQDELHDLVRAGGEEGPWVVRLREELVEALASLDDERIPHSASAWATTDEFAMGRPGRLPRHEIDALAGALGDMAGLARIARERGEPMYLLMSL